MQPIKAGLNGALQRAWTTLFHTPFSTCMKILLQHLSLNQTKYGDFVSELPATEKRMKPTHPPHLQADAFPLKIPKGRKLQ